VSAVATVRWSPIESDLLASLEAIAAAPGAGPRHLVGPEGAEDEAGLARLLVREARQLHELERDVARRHAQALEREAAARSGGVEHDRTGAAGPRSLPGHEEALERLAAARRRAVEHERALARIAGESAVETARNILRRFDLRPRRELASLKANAAAAEVVEVFADGYALKPSVPERLAARRAHLGLPEGADWR
jgi:hypothetical protein